MSGLMQPVCNLIYIICTLRGQTIILGEENEMMGVDLYDFYDSSQVLHFGAL